MCECGFYEFAFNDNPYNVTGYNFGMFGGTMDAWNTEIYLNAKQYTQNYFTWSICIIAHNINPSVLNWIWTHNLYNPRYVIIIVYYQFIRLLFRISFVVYLLFCPPSCSIWFGLWSIWFEMCARSTEIDSFKIPYMGEIEKDNSHQTKTNGFYVPACLA